jgi:hypothetical protein
MKEIPVKTTLIKYEAFDGTRFDTKEDCFAYEGSQFGLLMQQLEKSIIKKTDTLGIRNKSNCFEPFNAYYVIVPKTRHDIFVLGQILEAAGVTDREEITGGDCDQPIILCVNLFCNVIVDVHIIRINDLVKDLTNCQFEVISNMKDTVKDNKEEVKIAEK